MHNIPHVFPSIRYVRFFEREIQWEWISQKHRFSHCSRAKLPSSRRVPKAWERRLQRRSWIRMRWRIWLWVLSGSLDGLDVAINNAAHCPDKTPLMEFDEKRWRRSMDATLTRTALCLKYEMQQMKRQGSKGSIVSIASVNTFLAVPYMPAYTSAKHALIGLTKHASNKGGPFGRSDFL